MNDIPSAANNFEFILYADDTSLLSTINIPKVPLLNINGQLGHVYDWFGCEQIIFEYQEN